jgi:hypothetical protein
MVSGVRQEAGGEQAQVGDHRLKVLGCELAGRILDDFVHQAGRRVIVGRDARQEELLELSLAPALQSRQRDVRNALAVGSPASRQMPPALPSAEEIPRRVALAAVAEGAYQVGAAIDGIGGSRPLSADSMSCCLFAITSCGMAGAGIRNSEMAIRAMVDGSMFFTSTPPWV